MIIFEGSNTYRAYKVASLGHARKRLLTVILPLSLLLVLIGLILILANESIGLFFLIFGLLYTPLVYVMMLFQMKKHYKTNKMYFNGITTIKIDDVIDIKTESNFGNSQSVMHFDGLTKVTYHKGIFGFYTSSKTFMMADIDNLKEGSKDQLIALLKAHNVNVKVILIKD